MKRALLHKLSLAYRTLIASGTCVTVLVVTTVFFTEEFFLAVSTFKATFSWLFSGVVSALCGILLAFLATHTPTRCYIMLPPLMSTQTCPVLVVFSTHLANVIPYVRMHVPSMYQSVCLGRETLLADRALEKLPTMNQVLVGMQDVGGTEILLALQTLHTR